MRTRARRKDGKIASDSMRFDGYQQESKVLVDARAQGLLS